jgi:hypothetical protein
MAVMSNNLLNISDITNEALMVLENELMLTAKVNRQYDDKFGIDGAKIGYTVNARRPGRFKGTTGPALNVEDFVETSVPVTLTTQFHVDTQFITSDLLLSMDMFSDRVLKPKIATIANRVDFDGATMMATNVANITGTAGTSPTTVAPFLQAGAWLDSEGVPRDGNRCIVMDQWSMASMAGALTGLFNPQVKISQQYEKGMLGKATLGFDWYQDQNIITQTFGALGGTPQFSTTGTSSALLTSGWADGGTFQTKGWTASTAVVKVGDVFSAANVNAVNPQNRSAVGNGKARFFVVRPFVGTPSNGAFVPVTDSAGVVIGGTYTSDAGGLLQLQVSSAVISAGQFQNVTAAPANSANLTFFAGSAAVSPQNLAFHRDAFTLVSADLPLPGGVDMAARASHKDIGMSLRVVRQYTINNDALPTRIDVLYGWAPLYREMAVRVAG